MSYHPLRWPYLCNRYLLFPLFFSVFHGINLRHRHSPPHLSLSIPTNMEKESDSTTTFDMDALRVNLPQKRGLSRFYSGKSRSFACIADARCLDDLKKEERPKKRRKTVDKAPPLSCWRVSSGAQCFPPIVGM
ncbi:hypothetical protein NMG60_11015467 [Bertholletia excelsa]